MLEPNYTGYHGRCELKKYHSGSELKDRFKQDHALDRGMDIVRWQTLLTDNDERDHWR